MKNLNYIVATVTTTNRKVTEALEVVTNRVTTYPICVTRWMSEANGIAMTMASAWQDTDTGDRVEFVVLDIATQEVLFKHSTCQTGEPKTEQPPLPHHTDPICIGGRDIQWEPYDGVPADTGPVDLDADTF